MFNQDRAPCNHDSLSEMKDRYKTPKLKKPKPTRNGRLEQFLWKELYDEYIRYTAKMQNFEPEKPSTEYFDEFCKDVPKEDEDAKEALMHRFPLYCTRAITLYNHDGDITKDFKKRYSITRPVNLQTEQFG